MRLIEADTLLEELKLSSNMHAENSREFSLLHRDIVIVNEQPTVDAEPVIRCKDCKAFNGLKCVRNNMIAVRSIDYCSRAERKEE